MTDNELTPQQKAADLTYRMCQGETFSTNEIAETYGMTYHGARRFIHTISRCVPMPDPPRGGSWRIMNNT